MRPKTRPKMRMDRRDLAGLVVALLIAATCIRLGVWQVDRLRARRERNALLLAARVRPPLEVSGSLSGDSARDRRLRARGVYGEGDSAAVVGIGMLAPRARGDVDPVALRDSVPYRLLPFVVQQLPPATASYRPLPPGLVRWPIPELSDGPHLSYAIQWFSFAVIIIVGSLALARKRAAEAHLALGDGGRGTINALS